MDNKTTKPVLFVKKNDSKKGSFWNELTKKRIFRQHGDGELSEDDLHAIKKPQSPMDDIPKEDPKETEGTLTNLKKQIKQLEEKEEKIPHPHQFNEEDLEKLYENTEDDEQE